MPFSPLLSSLFFVSSVFTGVAVAGEPRVAPSLYQERIERLKLYSTFRQGKHFFRVGEYLEAAAHFTYLKSRVPHLPPALVSEVTYYLGSSLFEVGLYPQSKPYLVEAFRMKDLDPELRYFLFIRFFKLAAIYGSKTDLVRLVPLVQREPFSEEQKSELRYLALSLLFDLGAYPEVLTLFTEIPPASSRYPHALFLAAIAQAYLGKFSDALLKMGRLFALENLPLFQDEDLKNLMQKAYLAIAFEAGEYTLCLRLLSQFYPEGGDQDILYFKGWAHLLARQYREAAAQFQEFIRQYPDDPRTLELALLPGYIYFSQGKLGESYAFFETMETQFRRIEERIRAIRERFPSVNPMIQYMEWVSEGSDIPYRTIARWIRQDPLLLDWKERKREIEQLRNDIHNLGWNLVRLKISLSTLGSRLDHPISFDYRLRYEHQRRLFSLRSHMLEMMLRPIRHLLVYQEYRYVNIAQDLRSGVLKILDQDLIPLRQRVIYLMDQSRAMRDYIRLLTDVRYGEKVTRAIGEEVVLPISFLELGDRLITIEDELGEILHQIYLDEEELWKVIRFSFDLEYSTAIMAVKRLGIWNLPHLEPIRQMYQTAQEIEDLLRSSAFLGEKTRLEMLTFLRQHLNQELKRWEEVALQIENRERSWENRESEILELAYNNTVQMIANNRLRALQGKIDIRWTRKQILEKAAGLAHELRMSREEELRSYYEEIRNILMNVEKIQRQLDFPTEEEGLALEEARELYSILSDLEAKVREIEAAIRHLSQGSSSFLHRPGSLPLPTTLNSP